MVIEDNCSFENVNHEETQSTYMNVSQTKVKEEDDIPSLLRNYNQQDSFCNSTWLSECEGNITINSLNELCEKEPVP